MRSSLFLSATALSTAFAFPALKPEGIETLLRHPEARAEILRRLEERTVDDVSDSTGKATQYPTSASVEGLKRFPEADHPFRAPGTTDQRGPCPGLNTLANHGYIPRNGIATITQLVEGTGALFNMGADLALVLATGGAVDGGDVISTKMSIGGPDSRVGVLNGALNSFFGTPSGIAGHGKFNEGDASATRDDFYLTGDNISFQPRLFKQMHQMALAKGGGTYNVDVIKDHFNNRYDASKAANKQFYFNVPSAAVVMGAYYFIPGFMSNGTVGAGANEASITSFYGAQPSRENASDDPDLEYTHVPERIPEEGWYRRALPMSLAEAVVAILDILLYAQPQLGGAGADGDLVLGPLSVPNDAQGFGCFLYNTIYANFPADGMKQVSIVEQAVNFFSSRLAGFKALGCSTDLPDANGQGSYSSRYDEWAKQYVGDAKTKAVGSGFYEKA